MVAHRAGHLLAGRRLFKHNSTFRAPHGTGKSQRGRTGWLAWRIALRAEVLGSGHHFSTVGIWAECVGGAEIDGFGFQEVVENASLIVGEELLDFGRFEERGAAGEAGQAQKDAFSLKGA